MNEKCDKLVEQYLAWLRSRFSTAELAGGVCEITTPFLDRHNDSLQLFVRREGGKFILDDDGHTIADMAAGGFEITGAVRERTVSQTLTGFGVKRTGEVLSSEADDQSFAWKMHTIVHAMLALGELPLTARPKSIDMFREAVGHYLVDNGVRYTPNKSIPGRSGYSHEFDFVIPQSVRQPERLLKLISRPDRTSVGALVFAWTDTAHNRPDGAKMFAVLKDVGTSKTFAESAFRANSIQMVPWSQRDKFVEQFAA